MPRITTPRPESDLLVKTAKELSDGSDSKRRMRKNTITNMTGATLTREMKKFAIPDRSKGETGIMRIQVLHALGLGLPPAKYWTKKSIVYILEHIFEYKDYDQEKVKNKDTAIRFLQDFLDNNGKNSTTKKKSTTRVRDLTTLVPRYCRLGAKLRELGKETDAKICDHADKYDERIDDETLHRLHSITTDEQVLEDDTSSSGNPKRLFSSDLSPTPAKLQKRKQRLMEQVSTVDKLLRKEVEESQRLRIRRQTVSYAELDNDDTASRSSSVSNQTEDVELRYPTTTTSDPQDRQLRPSNSIGSFGIVWNGDDSYTKMITFKKRLTINI